MISAIFKRNFVGYFRNPTGYVFIMVFVLLGGIAAFFQEEFFRRNLANLDTLNEWFPYLLLFFVPAVTMSLWSDEKRQGTDELLFTLPGSDLEIILGKYFAALGIYTVSLTFSLSYVGVLLWLGRPDMGLMFSSWLGYWLLGAALLAIGMVGSARSQSPTIGFILGALFCAFFVFIEKGAVILPDSAERFLDSLGIWPHFRDLVSGRVTFSALFYFFCLISLGLLENLRLVSLRRLKGLSDPVRYHQWAQLGFTLVALITLNVFVARARVQGDVTAEKIHSISSESENLLENIPADRPVFLRAYISPEVPKDYVQTRLTLLDLLQEFESLGGGKIVVELNETEEYTPEANKAKEYGIRPQQIFSADDNAIHQVWLGAAFISGEEEVVVPFFFKGLSVEYELTSSISAVTQQSRRKVGILSTDAKLSGGFDMAAIQRGEFRKDPPWMIVTELERQYEVVQVSTSTDYPEDLNVLLVPLPSSLLQAEMDRLATYIRTGKPVFLLFDPYPIFSNDRRGQPSLAPWMPKPRSPMSRQAPPPKGNLQTILKAAGVNFAGKELVWQSYNPHPKIKVQQEILFVAEAINTEEKREKENSVFEVTDSVTSGLQEMIFLFSGRLTSKQEPGLTFQPIIRSATQSGAQILSSSGWRGPASTQDYVLAARVTGEIPGEKEGDPTQKVNIIALADVDLISNMFFQIRREQYEDLEIDNVTFALNCIDSLAGDESMIELRKRRPRHRTLDRIAKQTKEFEKERLTQVKEAEEKAETQLEKAKTRLQAKVAAIQNRTDLDEQTKNILKSDVINVAQRLFDSEKIRISEEKDESISKAKEGMETDIRNIQKRIRLLAILLPPIPAFLLALFFFMNRVSRERQSIPKERWVRK